MEIIVGVIGVILAFAFISCCEDDDCCCGERSIPPPEPLTRDNYIKRRGIDRWAEKLNEENPLTDNKIREINKALIRSGANWLKCSKN